MWVQKTAKGRYQYVERYIDPLTRKRKKTSVTLDTDKRSDRKLAERLLRERVERLTHPPKDFPITMGELVTRRLRWQSERLKEQTVQGSTYKLFGLADLLGASTLVTELTAPYVRDCLKGEPCTFNERLKHFKSLMRWAYREEIIEDISFIDRIPPEKHKPSKSNYMERDELSVLLDSMNEQWGLLTRFLALSGLRVGEASALLDSDVGDEIIVNKTLSLTTHKISTTKTESSERTVYVQDELRDCIEEIRKFKRKFSDSPIFFTVDDGYLHYASYSKYFREKTEKVLGHRLTPHSLRHTHVALLAENGVPLEVISRRLGHANSKVTRDIYFHVTKRLKEKDNEAIKNVKII